MVDNFELIKSLFYFSKENNMFLHCQIISRNKDLKEGEKRVRLIKPYFIVSKEHLDSLKDEIIWMCEHYKARAYIGVSGKDFSNLNIKILERIANNISIANNSINPLRILNSAAGEIKPRLKRWIIDVDDLNQSKDILNWLDNYFKEEKNSSIKTYLYATIPTKSGLHYITTPFNYMEFKKSFPNISIFKDNVTVLYIPKSIQ